MGFFRDLLEWYGEQERFKEASGYSGNLLSYISKNFNEEVIKPTKEDFKVLKQDLKNNNQELKNDLKKICNDVSPPIGKVVESCEKVGQTINNHVQASVVNRFNRKKITDMDELEKADHLFVEGIGKVYTHHGLYLGNGEVMHYSEFTVSMVTIEEFSKGRDIFVLDSPIIHTRDNVVYRAYCRLDEKEYNLIFNNCEHFVRWCRSSDKW